MEYTNDIVLNVKYVRETKKVRENFINRIWKMVSRSNFIVVILVMTTILVVIDTVLVASFFSLLSAA